MKGFFGCVRLLLLWGIAGAAIVAPTLTGSASAKVAPLAPAFSPGNLGTLGPAALSPIAGVGTPFGLGPERGRYIVVLKDSIKHPAAIAEDQAEEVSGDVGLVYRSAIKGYSAVLPKAEIDALEEDPRVSFVTPDRKLKALAQTTPTGITRSLAASNKKIKIDGEDNMRVDVDVAVIDTGIDYTHPDLNVVERTDCVSADSETQECVDHFGTDGHSHGTHVAGTIAALDNGEGVVGVAPGARLWGVRVLNDEGWGYSSSIIAGIDWVTAHSDQIEVANMSLGGFGPDPATEQAVSASAEAGVVYAVAAGNSHKDAKDFHPAANPDVITVSALADYDGQAGGKAGPSCSNQGADDTLAAFSNFGATVDVAAPGVCIKSTVPGGGYATFNGTSMASPHVAGAAALIASHTNPEDLEDVEAIRQLIVEEGSSAWTDNSGDGVQEPLLEISDEGDFAPADQVAVTGAVKLISTSEVELNGAVSPGGKETEYRFEYGPTTAYGYNAPVSPAKAGSGATYVPVSQVAKGLSEKTLYHYRLVAISESHTSVGVDRMFGTTPPKAETEPATEVEANWATLEASVDPAGLYTDYYFEFGPTSSYGHRTVPAQVGPGGAEEVEAVIGGLVPSSTYHYRVVATSSAGSDYGSDLSFTTIPSLWKQQDSPALPSEYGQAEEVLTDVSCAGEASCMSVGWAWTETGPGEEPEWENEYPVAERWDGESWEIVDIPDRRSQKMWDSLMSVSCVSEQWCMAAGISGTGPQPFEIAGLVEIWDGEEWLIDQEVPDVSALTDITCTGPTHCIAVGWDQDEGVWGTDPVALAWNDGKWTEMQVSSVSNDGVDWLKSVSCSAATSCVAVGAYVDAGGNTQGALISQYDGTKWVSKSLPGEEELHDVSCARSDEGSPRCLALQFNSAAILEEGAWSFEDLPVPPGARQVNHYGAKASCTEDFSCAVAGYSMGYKATNASVLYRDAEGWGVHSTAEPAPYESPVLIGSFFEGISCWEGARCTAVGGTAIKSGTIVSLAERLSPPRVSTGVPRRVRTGSAILSGSVNPEGHESSYYFEYGLTTSYGTKVTLAESALGDGQESVAVEQAIASLESEQTYHYRLVATSDVGSSYGEDRQFTAGGSPPTFTTAVGKPGSGNGEFHIPYDVAVDSAGNLWVADIENSRIQKLNPAGEYLSQFGSKGTGNGQFEYPAGVSVDSAGNLWVTDFENHRIQKFNSKGEYLSQFGTQGTGNGQFEYPEGAVTFDASGNFWIADTGNNRIQKFNSKGEYLTQFGTSGSGNGQFNSPMDLAIDASGNLWVVDSGNNRVQKFNSSGAYLSQFGSKGSGNGQFNCPIGIAIDASGRIWVTDTCNYRIEIFNSKGEYLTQFGTSGSGKGQFNQPLDIAFDLAGDAWVADAVNGRLQEWGYLDPTFTTAVGKPGSGNGEFHIPYDVAVDSAGNLWVADIENSRIQKLNPAGEYLSQFGSKGTGNGQFEYPAGVSVDSAGNLWVTDFENHRIQKFNSKGEYLSQFGTQGTGNGQFEYPEGAVTFDASGNFWIADTGNNRIQKFNSKGEYLTQFGTSGSGNGQFNSPMDLAIDASGNLWVVDSGNNRVQKFNSSGAYLSQFGSKGSGNGQFNCPIGIAIDASGRIWVTDTCNYRIEIFNSKGEYLTQFGTSGSGKGQFNQPLDIAFDLAGDAWVADAVNGRLQEWSP